ncbi:MAG: NAD(P)H-dependent oxidoreductase [Candidatus Woesearchaeota archaeon]|jgi:NAD(P)H dehydrogenase (quinone)
MKTTIIYAHPLRDGHNALILQKIETELKEKKEKYEVLDLYKMKYDPVFTAEELNRGGKKVISPINKKLQDTIQKSDNLIFIYPIWWNSPPAILKGFIDRVFSAGFAFKYTKTTLGTRPIGLLKGKKALVYTTSGGPNFFFKYFAGSRGSKVVAKDTLGFCGIKTKAFHYGNATKVTPNTEKKLEKLVKKGINAIY